LLEIDNLQNLKSGSYLPQVLAYNLPRDLALSLAARVSNLPGLNIEVVGVRSYPDNSAWGHLLGYVGQISDEQYKNNLKQFNLNDLIGQTGLEKIYDNVLRGVTGKREVEVAPSGTELKIYTETKAVPGQNFYLSVDADLQELIYKALAGASTPRGIGGSAIVVEVKTGQILALASYPSFNPNNFTIKRDNKIIKELLQNSNRPLFNRALQGTYPPGSTIKPIIGAAALQENVITPRTTFLSTGGVQLGNRFFADWKPGGHCRVDIIRALAESVNTFFYLIGGGNNEREGLGVNRITSYLKQFKFNEAPQIDLPQVEAGFVPSPEWKQKTLNDRWFLGDTYNISIGQGNLLVTPLGLLKSYVALLNNGKLIDFKISDDKKNNLKAVDNKNYPIVNLRPEVFDTVKQGMRQTVVSGSARSLNTLPIAVAGKTGTAQAGTGKMPHAWFAGYAPYDNPEIVVVVMLENGGEGSSVAVPIAREIFAWYAANRDLIKLNN
ncbi:MAG: penicillin-binding protein 2, partial [Patescibacteria group bacterium]